NTQKRILTLALLICVAATALGFRLFKIQLLDGNGYGRAALRQRTQGVAWGFARGDFLDANGQPLTGRSGVWKAVLFP
ncbi:MAG TPA: penicillin-binding protein, partial [Firmicutes bacterium]|nr:penicillin-binding protein [Bacillota bacterium]